MSTSNIASLQIGGLAPSIKIRVLRQWNPRYKDKETCFMFIDKNGDTIQAIVSTNDQANVESRIHLMECYNITDYACTTQISYANVLTNPIHLRLGAATTITPVVDSNEFPREHYSISRFEELPNLKNQDNKFTDFIGVIEQIEDNTTRENKAYVNLLLADESDNSIILTLWNEICTSPQRFNRSYLQTLAYPVIIAATSVRVTSFQRGPLKLVSSSATYVYPHPTHPAATNLINKQHLRNRDMATPFTTAASRGERVSISSLTNMNFEGLIGKTFICQARLIDFISTNSWYYVACPSCLTTIFQSGTQWFCPSHGYTNSPRMMYRLVANIADETSSINVTMFDEVVQNLVEKTCFDMVTTEGFDNKNILPPPILNFTGILKDFTLRVQRGMSNNNPRFSVKSISSPALLSTPPPEASAPQSSNTEIHKRLQPTRLSLDLEASLNQETKRTRYPD